MSFFSTMKLVFDHENMAHFLILFKSHTMDPVPRIGIKGKLMNEPAFLERIEINPKVMVGKPVIKGTRIPVELLVRMASQGISETEILAEYPRLEIADIRAALAYAAMVIAHEDIFPITI